MEHGCRLIEHGYYGLDGFALICVDPYHQSNPCANSKI